MPKGFKRPCKFGCGANFSTTGNRARHYQSRHPELHPLFKGVRGKGSHQCKTCFKVLNGYNSWHHHTKRHEANSLPATQTVSRVQPKPLFKVEKVQMRCQAQ